MKNKKNLRFPVKRKGYDVTAVESYISAEAQRNESAQLAARERICALEAKCDDLKKDLAELKSKEEQIKTAFIAASRDADRLTADVKARYALELDRLRLFRAKWTGAYEQLKERYHFDKDALNMESVAVSVELDLQKFLSQDFSLNKGVLDDEMETYFKSEVARLTAQQATEQEKSKSKAGEQSARGGDSEALSELKDRIREAGSQADDSAAFSLDEALHPTESLAEICRALGLKAL